MRKPSVLNLLSVVLVIAGAAILLVIVIGRSAPRDIASEPTQPPTETPPVENSPIATHDDSDAVATTVAPTPNPTLLPSDTPTPLLLLTSDAEIAFVSNRDGIDNIYLMNRDGTNVQRLTYNGNTNTDPDWSPDGDWIAFASLVGAKDDGTVERAEIMIVNADGSGQVSLTQGLADQGFAAFSPKWSPDGSQIAFYAGAVDFLGQSFVGWNIYVVNADGSGEPHRLTDWEPGAGGGCIHPLWSADGKDILTYCRSLMQGGLMQMDVADSSEVLTYDWPGASLYDVSVTNLRVLSDGYQLVTVTDDLQPGETLIYSIEDAPVWNLAWSPVEANQLAVRTTNRVFVIDAITFDQRLIADNVPLEGNGTIEWSSDGAYIVFVASVDGDDEIMLAALDGSGVVRLTSSTGTDSQPTWRP